jgi:hypothetical protein
MSKDIAIRQGRRLISTKKKGSQDIASGEIMVPSDELIVCDDYFGSVPLDDVVEIEIHDEPER